MSLIPNAFLFETQHSIPRLAKKPARKSSLKPLGKRHEISSLQTLDHRHPFATIAVGWHEDGLQLSCQVTGKQTPLQCDAKSLSSSDGLTLWIDTRNTPGVHRANRFCHQFVALPSGGGKQQAEPLVEQIEIARCREKSPLATADQFWAKSAVRKDGYELTIWIPAEALNGYDPEQSEVCGFFYAVRDQELGLQTISVGDEFPFRSDPSLWQSLELVE